MQEIICILDGSGSMGSVAEEAKNGFNEFLKKQQELGEANITIAWFDNDWKIDYEGSLTKSAPLESWKIGGMTALYDAIGKTMNHVNPRFAIEKPEKVIMAIQTDGMENASKEFKLDVIKKLIQDHESKYGWEVIFLGAGLDAANQAINLGIRSSNTFTYDQNHTKQAIAAIYSASVTRARTSN